MKAQKKVVKKERKKERQKYLTLTHNLKIHDYGT
jgi:hypothetical protein